MSSPDVIDGIIITIFSDMGPNPVVNTSSLNEEISMKLAIAGMTILSMGYGGDGVFEKRHYRLHGPIPVPDSGDYEALALSFSVRPTNTDDVRVLDHGRETTLWLVFSSTYRNIIYSYHSQFEIELKKILSSVKDETDVTKPELTNNILDSIRRILAVKSTDAKTFVIEKEELDNQLPIKLFTVDNDGDLVPITFNDLKTTSVLIFVNKITKSIFNIQLNENTPQRKIFMAGRAASLLNSKKYHSEFHIRNVTDEIELAFLMEKIKLLQNQLS